MSAKTSRVSFETSSLETVTDRLKVLIGSRSVQQVSSKWGVNRSTINNYLKRGSKPRIDILTKVAAAENVSVEWLIYGHIDSIETTGQGQEEIRELTQPKDSDTQKILAILDGLEPAERAQLAKVLSRKGAEVLALLLEQGGLDLLRLSGEKREAALSLQEMPADRIREILLAIKQCSTITEEVNYKHQASA